MGAGLCAARFNASHSQALGACKSDNLPTKGGDLVIDSMKTAGEVVHS